MEPADAPAHVQRLRSGSRVQQLQAATALRHLAVQSPEARQAIVAAGAIPLLVQHLSSSTSDVMLAATAAALANLTCEMDPAAPALREIAEAIPAAVRLLQSSSSEAVQVHAARLLGSMAFDSQEIKAAVVAAGGTEALVRHPRSASEQVVAAAATALVFLAHGSPASQAPL
jgi:vacuolar protein 8